MATERACLTRRPADALAPTRMDALAAATRILTAAGVECPRVDAEWLLAGVLGVGRAALYLDGALAPDDLARFERAVRRRATREPLQRVLGWEEFHGLRFALTDAVLVPRPETESLVDRALALLEPVVAGRRLTVVDVGTGSGCVACALAARRSDVDVTAIDIDVAAVAAAKANAVALGLARRVRVVAGDLVSAVRVRSADLIVSNPPYVPSALLAALSPEVRVHDPRVALDGGPDGLDVLRRLVADGRGCLVPGGALALETAGGPQAEAAAQLMNDAGFGRVVVHNDLAGIQRFVTGRA